MSESIHGQKVMQMMAGSAKQYTKQALKTEMANEFGEETRFHTCHDSDLSADDLIDYLANKGKFILSEQGMSMPSEGVCES